MLCWTLTLSPTLINVFFLAQILGLAGDNAENNSTMVDCLYDLIPSFEGQQSRIRCFLHILNLVVKAILSVFTSPRKCKILTDSIAKGEVSLDDDDEEDEEDEDNDEDIDPEREAWDQEQIEAVGLELEEQLKNEEFYEEVMEQIKIGTLAMKKVWCALVSVVCFTNNCTQNDKLCRKSAVSGEFSSDLMESAKQHGNSNPCELIKPVSTRWNTKSLSISSFIPLREAIEDVCDRNVWNNQKTKLRRYIPTDDEWSLLEDLEIVLEVITLFSSTFTLHTHRLISQLFLNRTLEFSKAGVPLIHKVIPSIDSLTDALSDVRDNQEVNCAVRFAVTKGITMLNKYYSKTDESAIYRVAMSE
jgi:hypothetical protein